MGLMSKKSPSWFSGWQQRVFILQDRKIMWFKFTIKPNKQSKRDGGENQNNADEDDDNEMYQDINDHYESDKN